MSSKKDKITFLWEKMELFSYYLNSNKKNKIQFIDFLIPNKYGLTKEHIYNMSNWKVNIKDEDLIFKLDILIIWFNVIEFQSQINSVLTNWKGDLNTWITTIISKIKQVLTKTQISDVSTWKEFNTDSLSNNFDSFWNSSSDKINKWKLKLNNLRLIIDNQKKSWEIENNIDIKNKILDISKNLEECVQDEIVNQFSSINNIWFEFVLFVKKIIWICKLSKKNLFVDIFTKLIDIYNENNKEVDISIFTDNNSEYYLPKINWDNIQKVINCFDEINMYFVNKNADILDCKNRIEIIEKSYSYYDVKKFNLDHMKDIIFMINQLYSNIKQ